MSPSDLSLDYDDTGSQYSQVWALDFYLINTTFEEGELQIITYVVGYVAFQLTKRMRCSDCEKRLTRSSLLPEIGCDLHSDF